jgi:hypothetical protein
MPKTVVAEPAIAGRFDGRLGPICFHVGTYSLWQALEREQRVEHVLKILSRAGNTASH